MNVIIIGGGQVGAYIAGLLIKNNCDVKVIENRESVFDKLRSDLPDESVIAGSGTDPDVLEAAGIANADIVAAVTGADEVNLVAATITKFEFGVPRVIARVNNPKNTWLFNAGMGVDVGLNQADLMAHIIVEEMNLDAILTLMRVGRSDYQIAQIKTNEKSKAIGQCVKDLAIPQNALMIAIYRGAETVIPYGGTVIKKGDSIIALADGAAMQKINTLFGTAGQS